MKYLFIPGLYNVMNISNLVGANGIFNTALNVNVPNAATFNTLNFFGGRFLNNPEFTDKDIFSISEVGNELFRFCRITDTENYFYAKGILITTELPSFTRWPFIILRYSNRMWYDYTFLGFWNSSAAYILFARTDPGTVDFMLFGNKIVLDGVGDVFSLYTRLCVYPSTTPCLIETAYYNPREVLKIRKNGINSPGPTLTIENESSVTGDITGLNVVCNYGDMIRGYSNNLNKEVFRVKNDGTTLSNSDFEVLDSSKGLILKSPNGTRWRVTIDDTGNLVTTQL